MSATADLLFPRYSSQQRRISRLPVLDESGSIQLSTPLESEDSRTTAQVLSSLIEYIPWLNRNFIYDEIGSQLLAVFYSEQQDQFAQSVAKSSSGLSASELIPWTFPPQPAPWISDEIGSQLIPPFYLEQEEQGSPSATSSTTVLSGGQRQSITWTPTPYLYDEFKLSPSLEQQETWTSGYGGTNGLTTKISWIISTLVQPVSTVTTLGYDEFTYPQLSFSYEQEEAFTNNSSWVTPKGLELILWTSVPFSYDELVGTRGLPDDEGTLWAGGGIGDKLIGHHETIAWINTSQGIYLAAPFAIADEPAVPLPLVAGEDEQSGPTSRELWHSWPDVSISSTFAKLDEYAGASLLTPFYIEDDAKYTSIASTSSQLILWVSRPEVSQYDETTSSTNAKYFYLNQEDRYGLATTLPQTETIVWPIIVRLDDEILANPRLYIVEQEDAAVSLVTNIVPAVTPATVATLYDEFSSNLSYFRLEHYSIQEAIPARESVTWTVSRPSVVSYSIITYDEVTSRTNAFNFYLDQEEPKSIIPLQQVISWIITQPVGPNPSLVTYDEVSTNLANFDVDQVDSWPYFYQIIPRSQGTIVTLYDEWKSFYVFPSPPPANIADIYKPVVSITGGIGGAFN